MDDATFERVTAAEKASSSDKVVVITQTEATLRDIWASVLKLPTESISLDRSFLHMVSFIPDILLSVEENVN